MGLYTIRSGAKQMSENLFLAFNRDFLASGGVVSTLGTDFKAAAQSSPDMTVKVQAGRIYLKGASSNAYPVLLDADQNVNVTANSSGNPRIDTVVVYNDLSAASDLTGSNVAKLAVIAGTPAASPAAPDNTAILASIGASNPYEVIGDLAVGNGVTSITNGNITDRRRKFLTVGDANAQLNASCYGVDVGSTDAYAITLNPVPAAYSQGMRLYFKANTTNTGACSLNANSLGAVAIKKSATVDLEDGDIKAGQIVEVVHDGTYFQLVSTTDDTSVITLADGATIALDSALAKNFAVVLGAAGRALTFSNMKNGRAIYLETIQDATGGRTITTWPSIDFTFATGDVDTANDRITVNKNIKSGTPIIFSTTGGAPAGLTAGTLYYAINYSATQIKVATSLANAQAGTAIDLTSQGTGTHTCKCQVRWNGGAAPGFTAGKYQIDSFLFIPMDVANGDLRGYATGDTI